MMAWPSDLWACSLPLALWSMPARKIFSLNNPFLSHHETASIIAAAPEIEPPRQRATATSIA